MSYDHAVKGSLKFSWLPPPCGQRHGRITRYGYELRDVFDEVFTTVTYATIDDLNHFTEYEFRVRAFTKNGEGDFTAWFKARTAEAGE